MKHVKRTTKTDAGLSLVETTCALFVATAGIFGVMQMHTTAISKTKAIAEYGIATEALNNELETRKALPFDALEPGSDQPFISDTPRLEHLHSARTTVDIRPVPDNNNLKEIRARIQWRGEHGRNIEKSFVTLISNKKIPAATTTEANANEPE